MSEAGSEDNVGTPCHLGSTSVVAERLCMLNLLSVKWDCLSISSHSTTLSGWDVSQLFLPSADETGALYSSLMSLEKLYLLHIIRKRPASVLTHFLGLYTGNS